MGRRRANGEGTIFQRKDGRWQGAVTLATTPGRQRRRTVYGRTQREALRKLEQLKRQVADGTLPSERIHVADYLSDWLEHKRHTIKRRTFDAYTYIVEAYITPHVGHRYLDRLRPLHVQNMMRSVEVTSSPDAANKARKVLYGALRQAVRWQLIPRNSWRPSSATRSRRAP